MIKCFLSHFCVDFSLPLDYIMISLNTIDGSYLILRLYVCVLCFVMTTCDDLCFV